jgi:hypothetical protein
MKKDFKGEDVEIYKLVESPTNPVLDGFTFENCTLSGPAVIYPFGGKLSKNKMRPSQFIVIPDATQTLEGVIGFKDCIVLECEFENVGIIGTMDFISRFLD